MATERRIQELKDRRDSIAKVNAKWQQANAWTILKHSIGKDLSRLSIPVVFNEPLSFLQRITEYIEYINLLDSVITEADPLKRIEGVAAFAVSALSSTSNRTRKPFNPILGETFELHQSGTFNIRVCCEQVSHHPPVSAFHVDSESFQFYGSICPKFKLRGQSLDVEPSGTVTLRLTKIFVYLKEGNMLITAHRSGLKCLLSFKPLNSLFGRTVGRSIQGFVMDSSKNRLRAIYGDWTEFLASCDINAFNKAFPKWLKDRQSLNRVSSTPLCSSAVLPLINSTFQQDSILDVVNSKILWKRNTKLPDIEFFNFTSFAMQLNDNDSTLTQQWPPTDSRYRPDIRLLEIGDLEGADNEKIRLEEKQRAAEDERKKNKQPWTMVQPRRTPYNARANVAIQWYLLDEPRLDTLSEHLLTAITSPGLYVSWIE